MNSLEKIENIGFKETGYFYYTKHRKNNLDVEITYTIEGKCLYAIVVGDEVKYVGMATDFKTRMGFYCTGNPAGTNQRIHEKIHECLKNDDVLIYVFQPKIDYEMKIKGIELDLTKALEYGIISELRKINDLWNK